MGNLLSRKPPKPFAPSPAGTSRFRRMVQGILVRAQADPGPFVLLGWVLLCTGNVLGHLGSRVLGHPQGESMGHLWIHWLLARNLRSGRWPLFRMDGVEVGKDTWVYPVDLSTHLVAQPLYRLFGDPAAYNLTALGLLLFAALATYHLARHLQTVPEPLAATVATVVAVFHPAFLGFAADGRLDSMTLGWAVLVLLMWHRLVTAPTYRAGVWLAVCVGLLMAASPNLTYVMAIVLTPPSVILLVTSTRRLALPFLTAGVSSALLVAPLAYLLFTVEKQAKGRLNISYEAPEVPVVERVSPFEEPYQIVLHLWIGAEALDRGPQVYDPFQLAAVLTTLPAPPLPETMAPAYAPGTRHYVSVLGVALLVLSLILAFRRAWPWLLGGALVAFLGFGLGVQNALPLHLPGSNVWWQLRSAPLLSWLPLSSHFSNYGLFTALGNVLTSLGCLQGLTALSQRLPRRARHAVMLGLMALWLGETQRLSPVPLPLRATLVRVPEPVRYLGQQKDGMGVTGTPINSDLDRFLQTKHGHPITSAWNRTSAWYTEKEALLGRLLEGDDDRCRRATPRRVREALQEAGIGWVVLYPGLLRPEPRERFRACLDHLLGRPTRRDDAVVLYDVRGR